LDGRYFGAIDRSFGTAEPRWPDGEGPRLLCYVGWEHAGLAGFAAALGALGHPALVHLRGAEAADRGPSAANVAYSTAPLDLERALDRAALVICHAGHGLTTKALLRGIPLVLLPTQNEQAVVAERVTALGAGLAAPLHPAAGFDYAALVARALGDPALSL